MNPVFYRFVSKVLKRSIVKQYFLALIKILYLFSHQDLPDLSGTCFVDQADLKLVVILPTLSMSGQQSQEQSWSAKVLFHLCFTFD